MKAVDSELIPKVVGEKSPSLTMSTVSSSFGSDYCMHSKKSAISLSLKLFGFALPTKKKRMRQEFRSAHLRRGSGNSVRNTRGKVVLIANSGIIVLALENLTKLVGNYRVYEKLEANRLLEI